MKAQVVMLRAYRPDDADALLALFRDTIRRVNVRGDAPDQIRGGPVPRTRIQSKLSTCGRSAGIGHQAASFHTGVPS